MTDVQPKSRSKVAQQKSATEVFVCHQDCSNMSSSLLELSSKSHCSENEAQSQSQDTMLTLACEELTGSAVSMCGGSTSQRLQMQSPLKLYNTLFIQ